MRAGRLLSGGGPTLRYPPRVLSALGDRIVAGTVLAPGHAALAALAVLVGVHLALGDDNSAAWFAGEAVLAGLAAFLLWHDRRHATSDGRRRHLAMSLRASEALLRDVFESSPVGMAILGRGGRPVFWNAEYARQISLFSQDDIRTVDTRRVYRDVGQRARILETLRRHGSVRNEEFEAFVEREGGTFWGIGSMERVTFEGQPATLVWILDITERKTAEAQLRQKERQLREFLEASPIGVLIAGAGGRHLFSNSRWREIGRVPEDRARELDVRTLYRSEAERRRVARMLDERGRVRDLEIEVTALDGTSFWVLLSMERITFEGQPATLAWFYDFSERKRAAEELRRAKERAEAATQAKSTFLATMSHEIRTPLNGIIGYADLLARADMESHLRDYAGIIRSSGRTLLAVINDVLDYSKIEAGHIELRHAPFDLLRTLRSAAAIVETAAAEKGLGVALDIAANLPRGVVGDPDRLQQIFLNLLGNAIKFTERGSVRLTAEAVDVTDARVTLRFAVIDTGIGIPAEAVGRLFQRFSQIDSTIGRRYGGTGLGLAICKELVSCMDGEIGVESTPGEGSTFWVVIPFERAKDIAADASLDGTADRPAARSGRLLVVDDHAINRDLARLILGPAGYAVDVVTSGAEAVRAVAAGSYDLVLMDVNMPGMDGFEATFAIQQLDAPNNATPIVAMTASAGVEEVERCLAVGMVGHIAKPFDAESLIEQVGTLLGSRASGRADAEGAAAGEAPDRLPILDATRIVELEQHIGAERTRGLARMLMVQLCQAGDRLAAQLSAGRVSDVRRDLHTLVSTSGSLGATRLSALCRTVLERARGGEPIDPAVVAEFDRVVEDTEIAMRRRYGPGVESDTD